MNPYPQKKVLTFNKHHEDFTFFVNFGNMSHLPESEVASLGAMNLTKVQLNGIKDALAKHQDDGAEFKGIKAHFAIDDSGLLSLSTVESTFEKVHPVVESEGEAASNETSSMSGSFFLLLFHLELVRSNVFFSILIQATIRPIAPTRPRRIAQQQPSKRRSPKLM